MGSDARSDAFVQSGEREVSGGLRLRPFTGGSLTLARRFGMRVFDGADVEAMADAERQRELMTLLFIQGAALERVLEAASDRDADFAVKYLLPFELEVPLPALADAAREVNRILEAAGAASYDVEPKPGRDTGPEPPPNC
jgi:hypothetical protein